jgi:hypothetical protein
MGGGMNDQNWCIGVEGLCCTVYIEMKIMELLLDEVCGGCCPLVCGGGNLLEVVQ